MTIAEQITRAKNDLDAVYEAGKKAGGTKQRREYHGTIEEVVVGSYAYATLLQDNLLAEIRTLDTLFVRVECDIEPTAYTIIKTWASNVNGDVIPAVGQQIVYRTNSEAGRIFTNVTKPIYDDPTAIGFVHITEGGELRLYSGSPNYVIRPCDFKVIIEW
jgi:hypothetical protein